MDTPNYIKSLLAPNTKKPQGRKVWSIDLETVWLPFFTATNTMGDTAIPSDALGCPMRLAYDKSGAVRFSQSGRPVVRVAKELSDNVRLVRDNFTANLINYAGEVMTEHPNEYKQQVEFATKAGEPIAQMTHGIKQGIGSQSRRRNQRSGNPTPDRKRISASLKYIDIQPQVTA